MTAAALQPVVTPADRLGLTISVAVIIHVMVVFGVGFSPEPVPEPRYESLEVVLVTQHSDTAPEQPDLLAQANLIGGGETEEFERPAAPVEAPLPAPTPDLAAAPAPPLDPEPYEEPEPEARPDTAAEAQRAEAAAPAEQQALLVKDTAAGELPALEPEARPEPPREVAEVEPPEAEPKSRVETPVLPTASQLITRSFALASVNAELQQKLEMRSKRPRRKFISASTAEYRYAAYMEAWRAKVERIGNLNYPDEARQRNLSGHLLLDVALNPDGTVRNIAVRRSSGHKILDDAAVRIVELAAPYAPFPEDIRREVDILHITRTWKFLNNYHFSTR